MGHEGNNVKLIFQPVHWVDIQMKLNMIQNFKEDPPDNLPKESLLCFGLRPDTNKDFDFKREMTPPNWEQQERLINMVY